MFNFDISLFVCAFGLAFVLEGCIWALFPEKMRLAMQEITTLPGESLRFFGIAGLVVGLLIVAVGRYLL